MTRLILAASAVLLSQFHVLAQNGLWEHAPGSTYAFWSELALGPPSSSLNSSVSSPDPNATNINLAQDVLVDVLHVNASALNATRTCYDNCLRLSFDTNEYPRRCEDFVEDFRVQACMCNFELALSPIAKCHEECLPEEIVKPLSGAANVTARCKQIKETNTKLYAVLAEANSIAQKTKMHLGASAVLLFAVALTLA